jgi:tRNA nucleotidyltransferase (CCA-adding enzyme)
MTDDEARTLLAAAVPANVREVCATLAGAGHQAVTVGGAVRDALLGRKPGDWDVATAAHPDQVVALFRHTIKTGIQHGTVTIVTGKGVDSHVEVTTFRGEGAYSDARRPDHVTFGVPLVEDLARRDLVVNAIAYDPAGNVIIDPFGGREDIGLRRLRAVGDAVARFTEDGLRVMRAMRFAAQLEFDLDPETEAAIAPALPSLAKVSRERVCDELRKTLGAREPSRGFRIAWRSGIIRTVLPELDARITDWPGWADHSQDRIDDWLGRVDRAKERVRLAALLVPLADLAPGQRHIERDVVKRVLAIVRALKFSNLEADVAGQLVGVFGATAEPAWSAPDVRRLLAELDRDKRLPAVELWSAERAANAALCDTARQVLADGHPLAVSDLAISGKELMTVLDVPPGPVVGRILALLVERVLEDPTQNTPERLRALAQQCELEAGR